jgi:N-acetylmuramoyl-L-alanine amidase
LKGERLNRFQNEGLGLTMRRTSLGKIVLTSAALFLICALGAPAPFSLIESKASDHSSIGVVYPAPSTVVAAPTSFIVGSVPPGHSLTCSGQAVKVNKQGFYAHVINLKHGLNSFTLTLDDGTTRQVNVVREPAAVHISEGEMKIAVNEPSQDLGVKAGDTVRFSVHATPNSEVFAKFGAHVLKLGSATMTGARSHKALHKVAHGRAVTYGESYQRQADNPSDLYSGFYRVESADKWNAIRPTIEVKHAGHSLSQPLKTRLSTVDQPRIAQTAHPDTIVRLGPGLARTTPLDQGVRVLIDGWVGTQMRVPYCENKHVWIDSKDLSYETDPSIKKVINSSEQPSDTVRTINMGGDAYGAEVRIPLNQRLPYQVEQKLNPNSLTIRLYGVTSDTDWITNGISKQDPADIGVHSDIINHLSWKQPTDEQYELTVSLSGNRQWGYKTFYDGTNLVLSIKRAPQIAGAGSLAGLKVCVDPGHGGAETGSIGCDGMHESTLNLAIGQKFKEALEQRGATVIMTRTSDQQDRSLEERVKIANENKVDFLISVHNNALPDGRDPWKEHGTSAYWYHPQSIELAKALDRNVYQKLSFPDLGARYQNLALARPTAMPAVLVEIGFMINPDEYAQLIDPAVQEKAAQALCDGLIGYIQNKGD